MEQAPESVTNAVLAPSEKLPEGTTIIRGYDFEGCTVDYDALLSSYLRTGFQASHFGRAIEIVNNMVRVQVLHSLRQYYYTLLCL